MNRLFVLREAAHLAAVTGFLAHNWQAAARAGRFLAVSVSVYKSRRSLEQNRRYWGVAARVAEQAWVDGRQYGPEVWHEHFKRRFIGVQELPGGGHTSLSSADLNVEEFSTFMHHVEAYAATELGVVFD